MKPRTNTLYFPLISKTPADVLTILTVISEVEIVTRDGGQEVSVFTCDQQLYRVLLDVIWVNSERWIRFYPRIGEMHWMIGFTGYIRK